MWGNILYTSTFYASPCIVETASSSSMSAVLSSILISVLFWTNSGQASVQRMQWCGRGLNPIDSARLGRITTQALWACKSHVMELDVRPKLIREAKRACAVVRLCYAMAEVPRQNSAAFKDIIFHCMKLSLEAMEMLNPGILEEYNINITTFMGVGRDCLYGLVPLEEKLGLGIIRFAFDYMSG
ncbi:uncharacterized protein LOC135365967 [Ornithodoros turicata]|uniref:uncharacterized protein LOC135365967 n=1 Tax=Ornithodoros turicata TaxID=34597 RepID=UPI0031391FD0